MDIEKVVPVGDRVLVEPVEIEGTVDGLIIPDTAKKKSLTGIVLAKGSLVSDVIQKGYKVMYSEHSGTPIFGKHLLMAENQILCVIKD